MRIVLASKNAHKLEEIRELLQIPGVEFVGLDAWPDMPEVVEDADTFEGNGVKKAVETAAFTGEWCLADDSGLEVDALGGAPGVYSARYAGVHGDDDANNLKVLADMEGQSERTARFVCALALSNPQGEHRVLRGTVEGTIDQACSGSNGFGYDVLFIPEGHEQTFGVLDPSIKAGMSHRANACRAAAVAWSEWLA